MLLNFFNLFFTLMDPSLFPHTLHVYRMFHSIESFAISDEFLYVFSSDQLYQSKLNTNLFLSFPINFTPFQSFIHHNTLFLASKHHLFLFDGSLHLIANREPLSHSFPFLDIIYEFSSSKIKLINLHNKSVIKQINLPVNNGICAASCAADPSSLFLGFENGSIFLINNLLDLSSCAELHLHTHPTNSSVTFIHKFNHPIISLVLHSSYLFISLFDHKLVRFDLSSSSFIYADINFIPNFICISPPFLLCSNSSCISILSLDLHILKSFHAVLPIKCIQLAGTLLYVGHADIISVYDIKSILNFN